MNTGGIAAWGLFEAEHRRTVREHFKLLSVFSGHKQLRRFIDLQALATARRNLTLFDPSRHFPWRLLGDNAPQSIAPAEWVRLNTPERESATWKDWRNRFHAKYMDVECRRNHWDCKS
jgi:hypothetical protein